MKSEASCILSWTFVLLIFCECAPLHAQNKKYNTSIEVQSGLHVQWNEINVQHPIVVNSFLNLGLSANSILYRRDYEKYSFLFGLSHMNYFFGFGTSTPNTYFGVGQDGPNHNFYLNSGISKNYRFGKFGIRPELVLGIGYVHEALRYRREPDFVSFGSRGELLPSGDTLLNVNEIDHFDNVLHFNVSISSQFSYAIGKHFDVCLTPYFTKGINTVRRTELDYFFKDDFGPRNYGEGNIKYRGTQFGLRLGLAYHLTEGKDFNGKQLKRNDWAIEASYLFIGYLFDDIDDDNGNHSEFVRPFNSSNMRLAFILNKQKYYRTYGLEISQYWVGLMTSNVSGSPIIPFHIMPNRLYLTTGLGKKFSYGNFHLNPSIRFGAGIGNGTVEGFEIDTYNIGVSSDNYYFEAYSKNSPVHFRLASRLALEYFFFKNFYVSVFPEYIQGINYRTKISADYTYNTGESGSVQVNSKGSMFGFGWAVGWYMK